MKRAPIKASPGPGGLVLGVVGTDTGVGKTIVSAALARAFSRQGRGVGVFKPFASDPSRGPDGRLISTDADLLSRAAGTPGGWRSACGELFEAPLSPYASAKLEKKSVNFAAALAAARRVGASHEISIIEGCGGWAVPLTDRLTTADFFTRLGAPVVIVARTTLGTINHALLTLEAAERAGARVLGIILNRTAGGELQLAEKTNPRDLKKFSRARVWGPVPFAEAAFNERLDRVDPAALPDLSAVAREIERLLRRAQPARQSIRRK